MSKLLDFARSALLDGSTLRQKLAADPRLSEFMAKCEELITNLIKSGGTLYSCGNGGSMCDAMHLTEELVARYKDDRPGVRAMHFGDAGTLTCWANDKSYAEVFERQVRTFCTPRDVLVAISTSGNSENVIRAIKAARELGVPTIGLTGASGGKMAAICDALLCVDSTVTARIQEIHISIIHAWCESIDQQFRDATAI